MAVLLALPCLSACDSKSDHAHYVEWIRDYENGAHVRSTVSDFVLDLQYQPAEYVLLQRGINNLSAPAKAEALEEISAVQHYILTLGISSNTDPVAYGANTDIEKQQLQYYFSYRFQDDITLEENGKVLPCILYHFEKPVNSGGRRTFVLGFENSDKNGKEAEVVIRSAMFGAMPVRIRIIKTNIPQIDL
jgi:hypothetical protein